MADNVVAYLFLDLAIIIACAWVLGRLAVLAGQPRVMGEIAAGALLGPTVLGRIWAGGPAEIFPSGVPLDLIGTIGLVLFMFKVGLDIDIRTLRREARSAALIQASGFVIPAVLGFLVGLAIYHIDAAGTFEAGHASPGRLPFALFLGTAMSITAFPVLARILAETGLARTRVGTVALASAALDDALAWILLAAALVVAHGGSAWEIVTTALWTVLFAVVLVVVVRPLLRRLSQRSWTSTESAFDALPVLLAGLFLSALATEAIGIHAIFGAFLFGVITPRDALPHIGRIEAITAVVLLPVFFAATGLRFDLFTLDSVELIGWLALLLVIAVLGKALGCGIAARLSGFSLRDSAIVGVLMDTRGLTELVVLSVGLREGLISDRTFAMMVVVAIVTTVIASPIVTRLARSTAIAVADTTATSASAR